MESFKFYIYKYFMINRRYGYRLLLRSFKYNKYLLYNVKYKKHIYFINDIDKMILYKNYKKSKETLDKLFNSLLYIGYYSSLLCWDNHFCNSIVRNNKQNIYI